MEALIFHKPKDVRVENFCSMHLHHCENSNPKHYGQEEEVNKRKGIGTALYLYAGYNVGHAEYARINTRTMVHEKYR